MRDNSFDRWYSNMLEEAKRDIVRRVASAMSKAYDRMNKELRDDTARIFKEAVDAYYEDYNPIVYNRRYSMYEVPDIRVEGSAQVNQGTNSATVTSGIVYADYNTNAMSFRDGGSGLFFQAFEQGWHGGADKSGEGKEPHPDPGTPYWREPTPHFTHWGRPAYISSTPPKEQFEADFEKYDTEEGPARFKELIEEELVNAGFDIVKG